MCLRYQQKTYALFMFFAVILFFSSFVFADFICQRDICIYETDIQKNISDLKFNISFNIFNNNSNKICFDIGAWVVKLGTNWTENININYSQNKTFKNYNVKISQIPAIEQRNILINVRDCQNHSKKTTLKIPVNLTKIIAKTNIENIYWKHENNKLFANVSIRNYDDDQNVSGDFYIKLEHNKKELDRKEKHIEAEFNKSLNYSFEFNTSEFLGGIYRLYAHYKYNNSYFDTKTSKEDKNVYIDGIGSDLEINCSFKDLKNKNISFNPANISFFINNTGNNSYSINTSIKINDIKTSSGEIDYFILCSSKNLSHKNNISFNCSLSVPNTTIQENNKEIFVEFNILNKNENKFFTKIIENKINISGLIDLGAPEFISKTKELDVFFNSFSVVSTEFFAGNFNQELRFVCNGNNRRGILSDFNGNKITQNYCNSNTAISINTERNKTYDIFIPIFTYPNCDEYYALGKYNVSCRVCKYDSDENKYKNYNNLKESFTINFNGQNKCTTKNIVKSCSCLDEEDKNERAGKTYAFFDVMTPKDAKRNQIINISFVLKNKKSIANRCKVKSYIFIKQKTANIGGWSPNEKTISLKPYESKKIILENTIKSNIKEDKYKYRIRATDSKTGERVDYTTDIIINRTLPPTTKKIKNNEKSKSNKIDNRNKVEINCTKKQDKIKIVIKNKYRQKINFTLFNFGLNNTPKTYLINRQKTIHFNTKNIDSKLFFIAEYTINNTKKYAACSVFLNSTQQTQNNRFDKINKSKEKNYNQNKITGRTIFIEKKGFLRRIINWINNILTSNN